MTSSCRSQYRSFLYGVGLERNQKGVASRISPLIVPLCPGPAAIILFCSSGLQRKQPCLRGPRHSKHPEIQLHRHALSSPSIFYIKKPTLPPPLLVHLNEPSIMCGSHRYTASPACNRQGFSTENHNGSTTTGTGLGGNRRCPPDQKASALPIVPSMRVSWLPYRRRQSKRLGDRL